jgi:hypothetical protein
MPRNSPKRKSWRWGFLWEVVILAVLICANVLIWGALGVGWDDIHSVIVDARSTVATLSRDPSASLQPNATAYPAAIPLSTPTTVGSLTAAATETPLAQSTPSPVATVTATPDRAEGPFTLDDFTNGRWLKQQDSKLALSIESLAWVADGVDGVERDGIQDLLYIAAVSLPAASSLVSQGWLQESLDDVEAEALRWLRNIGTPEIATSVVALGWVQDGIAGVELEAIENLSYLANEDAQVAASVIALEWIEDGIESVEVDPIGNIAGLARDTDAVQRIVDMPFLKSFEPPDGAALMSLRQLAALEPETFTRVMWHPRLQNGISNELAFTVATLYGVSRTNPGLIDNLLDPGKVILEQRTIMLPHAGEVVLGIMRTSPGAARGMDLLEWSVRRVEAYMGSPLPTAYVGLLYADAVFAAKAGTNFGTHIVILPEYDVDDGSDEAVYASQINIHEVAHYYWSGNEDWLDEGAADFMASLLARAQTDRPVSATRYPCAYARTIAELERLDVQRGDIEFACNYALGQRLFADLHRVLGEERFRQGFRALYVATETKGDASASPSRTEDIDLVREAFRTGDGTENLILERWYHGTEPFDLSHHTRSPVDSRLVGINGQIDEAYISIEKDSSAVSGFSAQDIAKWVYLVLTYSYSVSGDSRNVPIEIVEYYEDGFEYRRRSGMLTAEDKYIGGTAWFSIGPPPGERWASGQYWVSVYMADRMVAEVSFEVTP